MNGKIEHFRLIVKGDVQGVAFRAFIKRIAKIHKVKGVVRNLEDGNVEIFCECDVKTLEDFKESIFLQRKDEKDIFSPNVEGITVYKERDKEYSQSNPPSEFKSFAVDYGVRLNSFEDESLTRSEIGSLLLVDTSRRITCVGDKVEKMCSDMVENFNRIDNKYGSFSEDMKEIKDCFKQLLVLFEKYLEDKHKST